MEKVKLEVFGMSCSHCEARIIKNIKELNGISNVEASAKDKVVTVIYNKDLVELEEIKNIIKETGYIVK